MKFSTSLPILLGYLVLIVNADETIQKGVEGTWKILQPTDPIPKNAIKGGLTEGGAQQDIYVGRFFYDNEVGYLPASVSWIDVWGAQNTRSVEFSHAGRYFRNSNPSLTYEILVEPEDGSHYDWVPTSHDFIPENAVIVGYSKEPYFNNTPDALFVGRIRFKSGHLVGKVSTLSKSIFVPLKGRVLQQDDYEILVKVPR